MATRKQLEQQKRTSFCFLLAVSKRAFFPSVMTDTDTDEVEEGELETRPKTTGQHLDWEKRTDPERGPVGRQLRVERDPGSR